MESRWTITERQYESERKQRLKGVDGDKIADHFPLFVQRQQLTRYLARYEIFKKILDVKGSIVECGVHHGSSLMFFAQLSTIYEPYAFNREIIGFDTFTGFPHVDNKDLGKGKLGDMGDVDLELLKRSIELYDMNRPLGHVAKVKLVEGDATETIPKHFKDAPHTLVALLYVDFDLYKPAKVAVETILPRMPKGAVIAFDEVNARQWPGETQALLETLDLGRIALKKFPSEPYVSYAVLD